MKTSITALTEKDIAACAALYIDVYNKSPWNYHFTIDRAKSYLLEYIEVKRFEGFVIKQDGVIKGAVLAHAKTWWTGDILYIDEIFIAPQSQGLGFGRQLLGFIEQHAAEKGYGVLTLMTNKHMPASKFYESLDYLPAAHFVIMFKPVGVDV